MIPVLEPSARRYDVGIYSARQIPLPTGTSARGELLSSNGVKVDGNCDLLQDPAMMKLELNGGLDSIIDRQ